MKANILYEKEDTEIFNYNLTDHKIGDVCGFRNFDGKQKDIVCIGAAQAMGRYVHNPYPSLIQDNSDYSVANFGWGGVADYQYDTKEFVDYINNAKLLIYQINSGRSTKNFNKNFNLGDVDIASRPPKIIELYRNDFHTFMQYFKKNETDYLEESRSFRNKIRIPVIYVYIAKHKISEVSLHNIKKTKLKHLYITFLILSQGRWLKNLLQVMNQDILFNLSFTGYQKEYIQILHHLKYILKFLKQMIIILIHILTMI